MLLGTQPKTPAIAEHRDGVKQKKAGEDDEIDVSGLGLVEEMRSISRRTLVEGIIKPRLNEIFTMVGLEVKRSGFGGMMPSGVVITGGGALTVGATEAARRNLAMSVHIGTPLRIRGLIDEIMTPAYASSVGLLLYGASQRRGEAGAGAISRGASRIQMKGIAGRVIDLIKSFLP